MMSRKPHPKFMFGNSRPSRRGAKRGSRSKVAQIPFPGTAPDPNNLVLDLSHVVDATEIAAIKIVFHSTGDGGGVRDGAAQETLVAEAMEEDFSSGRADSPAFFYHLGDVVYYNGEADNYVVQYFKPYQFYQAPILAIAGNHDSSVSTSDTPGNLDQFMKVFCDSAPQTLVPDFDRTSMTEPYLYFTLEAPFVKIIGLYSNNQDEGLPLPAALAIGTPWADLTETGDTFKTNEWLDNVLVSYNGYLSRAAPLYANGRDLKDPYLSPIYGDFNHFPPTVLASGTRDLLLSLTVLSHRKLRRANVEAELHVFEGMSHIHYVLNPLASESRELFTEWAKFFDKHLDR